MHVWKYSFLIHYQTAILNHQQVSMRPPSWAVMCVLAAATYSKRSFIISSSLSVVACLPSCLLSLQGWRFHSGPYPDPNKSKRESECRQLTITGGISTVLAYIILTNTSFLFVESIKSLLFIYSGREPGKTSVQVTSIVAALVVIGSLIVGLLGVIFYKRRSRREYPHRASFGFWSKCISLRVWT